MDLHWMYQKWVIFKICLSQLSFLGSGRPSTAPPGAHLQLPDSRKFHISCSCHRPGLRVRCDDNRRYQRGVDEPCSHSRHGPFRTSPIVLCASLLGSTIPRSFLRGYNRRFCISQCYQGCWLPVWCWLLEVCRLNTSLRELECLSDSRVFI